MALVEKRPLTPAQRFHVVQQRDLAKKRPERRLSKALSKSGGRNCYGRITMRRRGGGHKRLYRKVDFRRDKFDIPARVSEIEYDPNRSADIALLVYADGDKRYILAPEALKKGDRVITTRTAGELRPGNNMPLRFLAPSTRVHAVELQPGKGAQIARSAGVGAQMVIVDGDRVTLKMPSGELRLVHADCRATIGEVGNALHQNTTLGKAGRHRWMGRRPRVRGVAMNPVDHPMGGGEAKTSGGGHPMSPWGQLAKGYPTRSRSKPSNKMILVRRNGRKMRR